MLNATKTLMGIDERKRRACKRFGRTLIWVNVIVALIGLGAIGLSVAFFAQRPALRVQIDATKTRAYSLSERTKKMLADLEGDWSISLVLVEADVDRATLRQVDEVLKRYDQATDHMRVERIDPTQPDALDHYEALLQRLRAIHTDEVERYEFFLDKGLAAYERARSLAQAEVGTVGRLMSPFPASDPLRHQLELVQASFRVLAESSQTIVDLIDAAMVASEAQPVPDYEKARDTLVAALTSAARDLATLATRYETAIGQPGLATDVRSYFIRARVQYDEFATELQTAADPMLHLEPLELTRIGRELARGEATIIMGPDRASVVPASQLLPRSNLRATQSGQIAFDQRFRGEQLLSSTIHAMLVEQMPMVVFVHTRPGSILVPTASRSEMFGVSNILKASQYEVREWSIADPSGQPVAAEGQAVVWVIVPPLFAQRDQRSAFEMPREERVLLDITRSLLDDGQSVLLPMYPSTMEKFQQTDPWREVIAPFGVDADTSRITTRRSKTDEGKPVLDRNIDLLDLHSEHSVASAVRGQKLFLRMPVPVSIRDTDASSGVRAEPVVIYQPDGLAWLDPDWANAPRPEEDPEPENVIDTEACFAIASTRPRPRGAGEQRVFVIGSVDWMLSYVADQVFQLGGNRVALVFPGNYELIQASIAWLAGMDDLIAQSPTSQQVARLEGLTDGKRIFWRWAMPVGGLGMCFFVGMGVWVWREGPSAGGHWGSMPRDKSTIVVAVVAVIGVAAMLFTWRNDALQAEITSTRHLVFADDPLPVDQIDRIVITRQGGVNEVYERDGTQWAQSQPIAWPMDPYSMRRLVTIAAELEATNGLEAGEATASLGLDPPHAQVLFGWPGGESRVSLGRRGVGGRAYLQVEGDPKVLIVDQFLHDRVIEMDAKEWRLRRLFDHAGVESTLVRYQGPQQVFAMDRMRRTWSLTEPVATRLEQSKVDEFLGRLAGAQHNGFILDDPSDLSQFGLDDPIATYTIITPVRSMVDGTPQIEDVTERILIGSPQGMQGQGNYAMREGTNVVFALSGAARGEMTAVTNLIDLTASDADPADVYSIRISGPDAEFILERDTADPSVWISPTFNDRSADANVIKVLLENLTSMPASQVVRLPFPEDQQLGYIMMAGLDRRPVDTVRLAKDGNGDWMLNNGEELQRILSASVSMPLSPEAFGLQ